MSDVPASPEDFVQELLRWSEALAGIARTGLGFTQSLYERERFEEVLKVASDMRAAAEEDLEVPTRSRALPAGVARLGR